MENILDSIRRILRRWVRTSIPLKSDADIGDTIIHVNATTRFSAGDEVMFRNAQYYETGLTVANIIDTNYMELSSPVKFNWTVSDDALLVKTFNQMFIQEFT